MDYIVSILILLLLLKIIELQKRIADLESHDPSHVQKATIAAQASRSLKHASDAPRTWIIPEMRPRRST